MLCYSSVEITKTKASTKLKEMLRLDSDNKAAYNELSNLEEQHKYSQKKIPNSKHFTPTKFSSF